MSTPARLPTRAIAFALGLATPVVACGEAGAPARQADRETPAESAAIAVAAAADSAAIKACDVITEAELEAILAIELEPARLTRDAGAESQCRWDLPGDPQRGVSITLRRLDDLELYRRVPGSVALEGVGEAAVWSAQYGQLAVLDGGRVLSLALLVDDPERAQAERIARAALERLGPQL